MSIGRGRGFFCVGFSLAFTVAACFLPLGSAAQTTVSRSSGGQSQPDFAIPPGTIVPARLNQTFSSKNAQAGQVITARIMQNVPLPNGQRLPAGAKLAGKIISVQSAANGSKAKIELRFDSLIIRRQTIPILTSLRALAGFMEVQAAQTPEYTPGFGTPYDWVPTRQIGGDEVYGVGGPVTNPDGERVGSAIYGGVLVHVRARPDSGCRGPVGEEDRLQALWVFSADACGVYGLNRTEIAHAGRTDPVGTIILTAEGQDLKLRTGDALLLRSR